MKVINTFLVLMIITIGNSLYAQPGVTRIYQKISYFYDVVNVQVPDSPDSSRLNIYLQVRYDDLQFIKTDSGYTAGFECTAVVYDQDDDFQVGGGIWKEHVTVSKYDQTNDKNAYASTFIQFDLGPADYRVILSVEDMESNRSQAVKFKTKARDFSRDDMTLSDIAFLNDIEYDTLGIKKIYPIVTNPHKGLSSPAMAFFEIYQQKDEPEAMVKLELLGVNSRHEYTNESKIDLTGQRTLVSLELPVDSLRHDEYRLKIEVKAGKHKERVEKEFFIRWEGIPYTAHDLDAAIKQIEYIASLEEWRRITNASDQEKMEAFQLFWKRHDPTPGTSVNEAMDAHYARVEYTNEHFSVMQRDGWRTDRGMLFIVLGPPDDIVRDPYPSDSRPWEIWSYYRISRRFEFIDYTGFGDYRFYHPYSMYELQLYMH